MMGTLKENGADGTKLRMEAGPPESRIFLTKDKERPKLLASFMPAKGWAIQEGVLAEVCPGKTAAEILQHYRESS